VTGVAEEDGLSAQAGNPNLLAALDDGQVPDIVLDEARIRGPLGHLAGTREVAGG
jgi:hypothetical protein